MSKNIYLYFSGRKPECIPLKTQETELFSESSEDISSAFVCPIDAQCHKHNTCCLIKNLHKALCSFDNIPSIRRGKIVVREDNIYDENGYKEVSFYTDAQRLFYFLLVEIISDSDCPIIKKSISFRHYYDISLDLKGALYTILSSLLTQNYLNGNSLESDFKEEIREMLKDINLLIKRILKFIYQHTKEDSAPNGLIIAHSFMEMIQLRFDKLICELQSEILD